MDNKYKRPIWLEIDLNNLEFNLKEIRKKLDKETLLNAVIKADGYGHGAVKIAKRALKAGIDRFSTALPEEGIELRKAGIGAPIHLLGELTPEQIDLVIEYDLIPAISKLSTAVLLNDALDNSLGKKKVHIIIDTGMGRIGFLPEEVPEVIDEIVSLPGLKIEGLFTHFAVADEKRLDYTETQFKRYVEVLNLLEKKGIRIPLRHVCNSGGTLHSPEKYLDAIRPGIILYGMWPSGECIRPMELKNTFEVKSEVALVRDLPPESGVGYGLRYMTRGREKIAVLPLGYGDGYTRALSMKTDVLIKGKRAPVTGNICMDQTMVDVTDIPGVETGDEVVIVGQQGNERITPEEIADKRNTLNYEVPISFLKRVPRIYKED